MAYHFRHLHLTECQLDELWTFVMKKEAQLTPLERTLGLHGDTWVWIAFAPISKLVPAWVAGKRTRQESKMLIQRLQSSTDGHIPFFTSDELPHYADALLEVYGQTVVPPRTGKPGRPRNSYKVPPDDLLDFCSAPKCVKSAYAPRGENVLLPRLDPGLPGQVHPWL